MDRQARLHGGVDYPYMRAVMRLGNADGVNRNSQLTINFDPQREVLRIHTVTLRRGNEVIDELRTGRIEVLQRETTLERALLDGSLTFQQEKGARLLIARLADPDQRIEALMDVQQFAETPVSDRTQELRRRWHALTARADARTAVSKVGSTESYQLLQRGF